ncbi:uncharacterized protein LOC106133018 [Amyelois transitella]|uniref:uncharacterized protein LOC106133018 n=1 Tax=Amyelois transitella TaxID=680683 RepID=UPI0029900BBF|nr:uncharacterized protein LOC106133018 [Amyelois transitella]
MMPILYLMVYLSLVAAVEDRAYCAVRYSRLCQDKGQHVGCQYPDAGPGESCENYTKIEFTEELKSFILNYINRRRQRIAAGHEKVRGGLPIPKPDIMMYVEWDRELAYLAQRLADQCRFVHDECRATVRYPYAGQTVGEVRWRKSLDSDQITAQRAIKKVFDAWWGEKRRVQPQQLTTPFKVTAKGTAWGHFSQLAIWKLRAVGCGAVHHGPPHLRLLLVCDYSHTNMLGQKTISAGPLATCPLHTIRRPRSQYPLLCSTIKYPLRTQDLEVLYDYEKEDERTETIPEDDQKSTTQLDVLPKNYDVEEEQLTRFGQRNSKAKEVLDRDMKMRNQIHIAYGPYQPPRSTTRRPDTDYIKRKNVEVDQRPGGYFQQKRPRVNDDYSVIPLRDPQHEQPNEAPWRPKLYWRTSTTGLPEYETSIVLQSVRRKYYEQDRSFRPTEVREKEVTHTVRRPLAPSLKLDKEDIDQLFKDTGFKPNWTPKL